MTGTKEPAGTALAPARADLAKLPVPPSATPLAGRLGISGWSLDMIQAALASIAANGLAAFLPAFAAHGWRRHRPVVIDLSTELVAKVATPEPAPNTTAALVPDIPRDAKEEADAFARAAFRPSKSGRGTVAQRR